MHSTLYTVQRDNKAIDLFRSNEPLEANYNEYLKYTAVPRI